MVNTSAWDLSWRWTSGSGVSTATDMINWTKALFRGSALSSQSLKQMTTPVQLTTSQGTALTMGFGLEVIDQDPWFGEKVYANSSTNPGMMTRLLYDPNTGRLTAIQAASRSRRSVSRSLSRTPFPKGGRGTTSTRSMAPPAKVRPSRANPDGTYTPPATCSDPCAPGAYPLRCTAAMALSARYSLKTSTPTRTRMTAKIARASPRLPHTA